VALPQRTIDKKKISGVHALQFQKITDFPCVFPGPFCGLLLASYGASVLRIDRPSPIPSSDLLTANKSSIALDLKSPSSVAVLLSLIPTTDILIDPFRPGVLEKLGLDPATTLKRLNRRLITVRLTGFRRDGKYSAVAGHDINYLAVSGVLSLLGTKGLPPSPPANILADFAGGGMVAVLGVLLALIHRGVSGKGQVVEANMVDGVSFLTTFPRLALKTPLWGAERGTNLLDGGCPYYGCYECKDGSNYMAVGALEPQFYKELLKGLQLSESQVLPSGFKGDRSDKGSWEYMKGVLERRFKEKTRKEWEAVFAGTDACCTPVLKMGELEKQGFDQRPVVGLKESPGMGPAGKSAYTAKALRPGEGSEEALKQWMGWKKGKEYKQNDSNGALVLGLKSKL
jgi:alpha-methylacyl-CoA racemase